jgi:hypothetical protein
LIINPGLAQYSITNSNSIWYATLLAGWLMTIQARSQSFYQYSHGLETNDAFEEGYPAHGVCF